MLSQSENKRYRKRKSCGVFYLFFFPLFFFFLPLELGELSADYERYKLERARAVGVRIHCESEGESV